MLPTLHFDKRHAGGDPHVARYSQQTGRKRRHRAHAARPRVDRRLARTPRYLHPTLSLLPANNLARHQAAQEFISIKGTQAIIRKVINTIHEKRDRHAGTELILQDLVWILAPLGSRGYSR